MEKKIRRKSWLISFAIAAIILIVYSAITWTVKNVNVEGYSATVRVPGEYAEEAQIHYNYDFVEQSNDRSVITLNFEKEGYYLVEICDKLYVFNVSYCKQTNNYTIDLLPEEKANIENLLAISWLKLVGIRLVVLILVCMVGYITSSIISKCKTKTKSGVETEETEHEEPDIDISR